MKYKVTLSKLLVCILTVSLITGIPSKKANADAFKNVTLGADLSDQQKEDMLKYFGVTKNEASVIEVNIDEENKYLGSVATKSQIGTKSISCSYVEPTEDGGLNVSTNNVYWINADMIKNALITAGIKNADIKVNAPFNVSGTAALTGILKGFESSKNGKKIDESAKKAANDELVTTGNLGEKIGKDKAAGLMNEIKKQVVKEKPKNKLGVEKIVKDVTGNYNYDLSDDDINKITDSMEKINELNLNYGEIKDQLSSVADKLGKVLKSDEAKGFFSKILSAIENFFSSIFN